MTRWIMSGPDGEPPARRYFEPPPSWPKWAHKLTCTPCRAKWSRKLPDAERCGACYCGRLKAALQPDPDESAVTSLSP